MSSKERASYNFDHEDPLADLLKERLGNEKLGPIFPFINTRPFVFSLRMTIEQIPLETVCW
jgi:hypothetical protein